MLVKATREFLDDVGRVRARPGARPDRLARAEADQARPGVARAGGGGRAWCAQPYFHRRRPAGLARRPASFSERTKRRRRRASSSPGEAAASASSPSTTAGGSVLTPISPMPATAHSGGRGRGSRTFKGLRLAHDAGACAAFPGILQVAIARGCDEILAGEPGVSSATAAIPDSRRSTSRCNVVRCKNGPGRFRHAARPWSCTGTASTAAGSIIRPRENLAQVAPHHRRRRAQNSPSSASPSSTASAGFRARRLTRN
jgi:hypothetical protein